MPSKNSKKTIHIINHIANNLEKNQDKECAALAIYNHINIFWAKPLKLRLIEDLYDIENQLSPAALSAAKILKEKYKKPF